jgi:hypothetical protein
VFDPDAVGRLLRAHARREADHSRAIWALLSFAVWYDEVLRGAWPAPSAAAPRPTPIRTETMP